jgi:tRNA-2-methylthio-N6-dimethylallyladenosine synthase
MGRTACNRIVNFDGGVDARGLIGRMIDIEITEALPHSLRGMLAGTAGDAAGIAAAAG